jgi:argininosuccinate lyase
MAGFMMSVKGTPSTYNKDLQEDKEPLFDCVDTVANSIRIAEGVIATLTVSENRIFKMAAKYVRPCRSTPTRCERH